MRKDMDEVLDHLETKINQQIQIINQSKVENTLKMAQITAFTTVLAYIEEERKGPQPTLCEGKSFADAFWNGDGGYF